MLGAYLTEIARIWDWLTATAAEALDTAGRMLDALALRLLPEASRWLASAGQDELIGLGLALAGAAAIFTALFLFGQRRSRRRAPARAARASLDQLTRRPWRFGTAAALSFLLVMGGWSYLAPLASAALAPGVVSPDGSRKTVEHLEGGIVGVIHVREGDDVEAGAPLVTLDDTHARARYGELRERYLHLLATEARLAAERAGASEIVFSPELLEATDGDALSAMDGQRELLRSRRSAQVGREQILRQRIRQLEEQNDGLVEVIAAQDRQIALIQEEIKGVEDLYRRGLEKYPRLLALKRAQADIEAERAGHFARIAENGERIGETEIQLFTVREDVVERANGELADIQRQLAELRSDMPSRADILQRTVIRAPISGTVMNIRPTTVTGVVSPGEPILEIVPKDTRLIIDARVSPGDIERVAPGLEARVMLTAYKQRNLPVIHGTLRSVSADRLVEDRTGQPYFLAKVEVKDEDLARLEDIRLLPGMPADVMILNAERTVVDYLLAPLLRSASRSFRED